MRLLLGDNFFVFKIFLFKKKTSHHFGNLKVDDIPLKTFAHEYEKKGIYFCGSATFTKLPSISPHNYSRFKYFGKKSDTRFLVIYLYSLLNT